MKLRQISFKIISMVMVFAMMFSISATTISAVAEGIDDGHDHVIENEKIYVSLGDSMTNGYGLEGYEPNGDNYYGFLVDSAKEAYPEEVAKHFGWNLIQLATSGLRADDIYYLLNYGTENAVEWDDYGTRYIVDKFDPRYDGTREEIIAQAAAKYQESIKAADVISVNVGSNNFATLMHMRMSYIIGLITGNNTMFGGYDGEFDFNELVGDLTPEVKAEIAELYDKLHAELFAYVEKSGIPADYVLNETTNVTLGWVLEDLAKAAAYTTAGFAVGFSGIMETINRENPTAEVIVVELANWFSGRVFEIPVEGSEPIIINAGDLFDELYNYANSYMALIASQYSIGDVVDKTPDQLGEHIGVVTDELPTQKIYFAEVDDVELIVDKIANNSKIDLEALYDIKDETARFEAALEIAKSIDSSMIPAGTTRIRLLERLGGMVIGAMGLRVPDLDDVDMFEKYLAGTFAYATENVHTIKVLSKQLGNIQIHEETINAYLDNANLYIEDKYNAIANEIYIEDYLDDTQKIEIASGDPARIGAVLGSVLPEVIGNLIYNGVYGYQGGCIAYLGLEKSMIASTNLEALNVTDLSLVADMVELMDYVFGKFTNINMGNPDEIAAAMIADSKLMTVDNIIFSFLIGDGVILHPSVDGHQVIADAIIEAYENGYTAQDKTLGDLITLGNALVDYVKENYDEIYADVYAELKANGYVDAAVAGVDEAIAAVNAAIAEVEGLDLHANLADSKALLLEELALVADTLADVKNLLTVADQLDAETYAELEALVNTLGQHLDNALALAEELGDVADAQLQIALADLEALAEATEAALKPLVDDIYNNVNTYLTETLPAEYEAFVDAVTDALRYYSAEAADYVYNWLLNNPVTVIEFFAEYGDDAVDFIADNAKAILGALAFAAKNYGEEILGFVLDNADVILTATVEWFSIHGEHVWELLVVYFDALVEYYNFDFELDFSSFEAIHESFNRVFVLLGDLVDLIAKGVYDFADALGILNEIEAELTNLNAKLSSAVRNQIDVVNGLVEDKIAALNQLFADKIDAINDFVAERIAELEAQAEAQINAVKAEIEAQIAALKAELETAVGEAKAALEAEIARLEALLETKVAEINAQVEAQIAALNAQAEAQIAVLEAELKALVEKEIQHGKDAIAALDLLLQNGVKSLAIYIYDSITNFVEDAVAGKFTPNEDTYYVSVNGGNADYADLLAEALSKNLDNSIALDKMTWGDLDYDKLALADLITIGFDENELSAFAVEQMLGYLEDYLNGDLRGSVVGHADALIAAVVNNLLETYPVYGLILGEYEQNIAQDYADELLNGAFDALVGNGELPEELGVDAETAAVIQWLSSTINGKDAQELDWAKYVGEENLHYVDDAREALRNELLKAGVIETYVLSIDLVSADVHKAVVEFLAQIIEESGLVGTSRKNLEKTLEDLSNYDNFVALFGEYATYTVEIPVVDSLVFAAESYLYNNVAFQAEYGQLILDLYEINPEATVVLLGHYNPFDFELALGDLTIDLTNAYGCVSGVASLQPFVYALLSEKVAYVDIYELETKYDSYVAEGIVENNLLNFVMMYLADNTITDASEAGNVYIYEQILNYLTIGCEHRYDNACDEICNKCGEHREIAGHAYDHACDTKCNLCGAVRETAGHDYADGNVCIHCGHKRPTAAPVEPDPDCLAGNHSFDDCHDRTCYKCDYVREPIAHVYDNCDDASCNTCGKDRELTGHVYLFACSAECYVCGETREPADHVYSGCTDVDCNVCGATRTAGKHTVDDCADNECNVCGQIVGAKGHQYGEWTETVEATRRHDGEQVRVCTKCDYKDVKVIPALEGLSGGAIAGVVVGSVVIAAAAGFAIFWFLIQKKSFAALIEGVKALAGGAAAPAAEAPVAEAPAAEAEAPATEEETK